MAKCGLSTSQTTLTIERVLQAWTFLQSHYQRKGARGLLLYYTQPSEHIFGSLRYREVHPVWRYNPDAYKIK